MSTRHRELLAMVFVLSILIWVSLDVYGQFVEPAPISYTVPFAIENSPLRAGEVLQIVVKRCNTTDHLVSYMVARSLVRDNGVIYPIESGLSVIQPGGCETVYSRLNTIPLGTPPGRYVLRAVSVADGLFRKHAVPWFTEEFEVGAP